MQCGRPVAPVVPPVPGLQFQLDNYAGKVRALSMVWFLYAAFSLLIGLAGLTFAHQFLSNHFGRLGHGPWSENGGPPEWLGPAIYHFVWVALVFRTGLTLLAGWGLSERTQWGRVTAIVAAFLSLLKCPFGTAPDHVEAGSFHTSRYPHALPENIRSREELGGVWTIER